MNIALDFGPHLLLDPGIKMRLRVAPLSDDQLFDICRRNDDWRIERDPNGDLVVRPLLGTITGLQVTELTVQLSNWARRHGGLTFGPRLGMRLPNGALRSSSAAWLAQARWDALRPDEKECFLPFCADVVAEIVSPFDDRGDLLDRMLEYREFGAKHAWLLDPATRTVDIFRPREPVRSYSDLTHLMVRDDPLLAGFVLDLRRIWNAGS